MEIKGKQGHILYSELIIYPVEGSCRTPSGKSGTCINLKICPTLVEILRREKPIPESSLDLLRKSHCGFEGKDPKVCCENKVLFLCKKIYTY